MSGQQQQHDAAQSEELFTLAVDIVTSRLPRSGPVQVDYASKLTLYALYKQAVEGNVRSSRPSFLDMLGRAKWDAWKEKKGLSRQDAELAYAETLARILHSFGDEPLAQALYRELQDKAGDHLASGTEESGSDEEEEEEEGSQTGSEREDVQDQPQLAPAPNASLVSAARRERATQQQLQQALQDSPTSASAQDHVPPLRSQTALNQSHYSIISHPNGTPSSAAAARAVRSAGSRTPAHVAQQMHQALTTSGAQLREDWLAEQQWRQSASAFPLPAQATTFQQQQQQPLQPAATAASVTEAHLRSHNRSTAAVPNSPRPGSVRPVPIPLETTLQAIHTSLQALHERISALEHDGQQNRARRTPWTSLISRFFYMLTLWRIPRRGGHGGDNAEDDDSSDDVAPRAAAGRRRKPSTAKLWTAVALGLWDQVRDGILIALLVAFLLRRRRRLFDLSWVLAFLPKYRLRLVQDHRS